MLKYFLVGNSIIIKRTCVIIFCETLDFLMLASVTIYNFTGLMIIKHIL
jgi:hypothetical protein